MSGSAGNGSSTGRRLSVVGAVYGAGLLVVLAHLAVVMLVEHEDWLVRSHRNRWAFRDVPSVRGALLDRSGRTLAHDEPTFELTCVYEHFRCWHPVGAAVHAAVLWSRHAHAEVRYGYTHAALGPEAALAVVLAVPVGELLDGGLPKDDQRSLLHGATTVLAACGARSRGRVMTALRAARDADPARPVGLCFRDCGPEVLRARFGGVLARLRDLDAALRELAAGGGAAGGGPGLLDHLDGFRVDCLEGRRTRRAGPDGAVVEGELMERLARPVLRRVPFAVAAALRVASDDQPGLRLEPSLVRRRAAGLPATLGQLLGSVADLDRNPGPPEYVEERVAAALGGELDELVPEDLAPTREYEKALRGEALRSYARVLRSRERRGASGFEATLDEPLRGAPGLRLVEHDARSREQLLWSSLRVAPGADVALTVDLDLQRLVEDRTAAACARWQREAGVRAGLIDAAMALVCAHSGDVLALAGAPAEIEGEGRVPAVLAWRVTGSIGSVVKPLFALEQLTSARQGLPHAPHAGFAPCERVWRHGGRTFECDGHHGAPGTDPVAALGRSCNVFFFQAAQGLGEAGLRRALWRFGLEEPLGGGGDGRYQARPAGLPPALAPAPRWTGARALPMRGIGYGIEANPLHLARAYAALATGALPELGFVRDQRRPARPLGADAGDLATVQAGLYDCVVAGTAARIPGLAAFDVHGKTGTAEISADGANNAWFAGYLPHAAPDGVQLAFCAVVYAVPHGVHGAEAGGELVAEVLEAIAADPVLRARYLWDAAPGAPAAPRGEVGR